MNREKRRLRIPVLTVLLAAFAALFFLMMLGRFSLAQREQGGVRDPDPGSVSAN